MKLVIKDGDSIRKRVYHHLRERILKGEAAPGERLIEAKIAREIGTSRTPVREALHSLELEKLIRSIPRVGYVVEEMSREEVEQICAIRGVIEGLAVRWAMERAEEKLLKGLQQIVAKQEEAIARDNLAGYVELDARFHEMIARMSGSPRLVELTETLRRHMLRYRIQCVHVKETALRSLEGHRQILAALESARVETVTEAIREHLEEARKDILSFVLVD
jgi:GntR family transcriptional regulator, rspAB operon transcriptional repressor